jgi:hypothetical protein
MGPIRVLLGGLPGILRDILEETFASQSDVMLVVEDRGDPGASLRNAVDVHAPDVVIVGVDRQDWVGDYLELFRDHPLLRILAIRNDGRGAVMHELSIRRYRVTDLTPPAILAAVRASVAEAEEEADALFQRERP